MTQITASQHRSIFPTQHPTLLIGRNEIEMGGTRGSDGPIGASRLASHMCVRDDLPHENETITKI